MTPSETALSQEPDEWKAGKFRPYLGFYYLVSREDIFLGKSVNEMVLYQKSKSPIFTAHLIKLFTEKLPNDQISIKMHYWKNGVVSDIFNIKFRNISHARLEFMDTIYKYKIESNRLKLYNNVFKTEDYAKLFITQDTLFYKDLELIKVDDPTWHNQTLLNLERYATEGDVSIFNFLANKYSVSDQCDIFFK